MAIRMPMTPAVGGVCDATRPCPGSDGALCTCPKCNACRDAGNGSGNPSGGTWLPLSGGVALPLTPGVQEPCGDPPPPATEPGTTGSSLLTLSGTVTGSSPLGMSYTINVHGAWSPAIPEGARVFHAVLQYGWTPFCNAVSWGFQDNYGSGTIPALVWNQEGIHAINGALGGDGLLNVIAVATWVCTGFPPHTAQFARVQLTVSWRTVD